MTWLPGSPRWSMYVPLVGALVSMVLLVACANPLSHSTKKADGPPHCADLVAHAMTVQAPQPVVGAYACFAASVQSQAQTVGITDDASFAEYAAGDPVYTAYRYVGKTPPFPKPDKVWYYFTLTPQQCYRLSLNADGLVDGGSFGPQGAACPSPLP